MIGSPRSRKRSRRAPLIVALLALLGGRAPAAVPDLPAFDPYRAAVASGDTDAAARALLALVAAPTPRAAAPAEPPSPPASTADHTRTRPRPGAAPASDAVAPPATSSDDTVRAAAWKELATLVDGKGLKLAALIAWSKAIEADPQGTADQIAHALDLGEEVSDVDPLAPVLANHVGIEGLDANTRSRMAYVAALHHLRAGNYGTAGGILMMVDKESTVWADSEALRGIVLSQQGRYDDAIAPLLTAQAAARTSQKGREFDDVMNLNVARAYYAAGNYLQAVNWFTKVSRASDYWPEAQFERAWAHFRADDLLATYALLMAHDSPFFDDWYFAEGDLLRAYTLFMLCKFPDASKEMDEFVATYTPLKSELDATLATLDPKAAFDEVRAWIASDGEQRPRLPTSLLRELRTEDRLAEAFVAVDYEDAELKRIEGVQEPALREALAGWVAERRADKVASEGTRILERTREAQTELAGMLEGIELTRLDLLQLETTLYERAAATGVLDYGDRIGKLRDLRKRKKKHQVWPFQGEYWADELGWYVVDSRPDCPADMQVGGGAAAPDAGSPPGDAGSRERPRVK